MAIKNWSNLEFRKKLTIIEEYKTIEEGSNLCNAIKKKIYEYTLCDWCLGKIIIENFRKNKKNGGEIKYRTPSGVKFPLALHNKCLKEALKDIDKFYRERNKK